MGPLGPSYPMHRGWKMANYDEIDIERISVCNDDPDRYFDLWLHDHPGETFLCREFNMIKKYKVYWPESIGIPFDAVGDGVVISNDGEVIHSGEIKKSYTTKKSGEEMRCVISPF